MEAVPTDPGTAGHYLATYGPRKAPAAAGLGILRKGRWLVVVEITADRADYPSAWNPARRAVRRIASTFA
jgi:hypothetical protein